MSSKVKLIIIAIILYFVLDSTGCTTSNKSIPNVVESTTISYDGNNLNSGVICQISSGGFIISESLYNKYNKLCKKYKKNINIPNIQPQKCYYINDETMSLLLKMNSWEKNSWLIKDN